MTAELQPSSTSGVDPLPLAARQPAATQFAALRRPLVCQLLHSLCVGGAEMLAVHAARQLKAYYRFMFVCLDELGELGAQMRDEGFQVIVLERRSGFDWRCARRLGRLLKDEHVDVLHAHQYTPFFYSLASRVLRRHPPVLFTEHGRFVPDYPRRKRIVFNRLMLRRRDRIVAVGESVRQALVVNEGLPRERIQLIYNGINLDRYHKPNVDRGAVRESLRVGPNDFVMIQVARLDELKDHATALRTIERIAKVRPDARLVIVGEGPQRSHIEREIAARQLQPFVRLTGLRHDVPELLAASDLFLLTSISEGIPLTLIEAMAAGLPIVSTNVGGIPEVVEDGVTGLLAPAGDDAALAKLILQLVADADSCSRMQLHASKRLQRLFDERHMHDAYRELYDAMFHAK